MSRKVIQSAQRLLAAMRNEGELGPSGAVIVHLKMGRAHKIKRQLPDLMLRAPKGEAKKKEQDDG